MIWSGIVEMKGGELLDERTVRRNVVLAVSKPSLTVTVMVALPEWSAAGVAVIVRLDPLPLKLRLVSGRRAGFEEEPVTRRVSALVSASPIVNGIGLVDEFWTMVWSAILDMEGA